MKDFFFNVRMILHNVKTRKSLHSILAVAILLYLVITALSIGFDYYYQSITSTNKTIIHIKEFIFLLLKGLVVSLLISIIISSLDKIDQDKCGKLRKLFKADIYNKVSIVVPEFDYEYFKDRLIEQEKQNEEEKFDNSRRFISKPDFFFAKNIASMFQGVGMAIPDVISVKDAEKEWAQSSLNPKKTYVLIGLHSNTLANKILQEPAIQEKAKIKLGAREKDPAKRWIEQKLKTVDSFKKEQISENIADYAVFVRLRYMVEGQKKCNVIILGGLNATGTEALSKFIQSNWEETFYPYLLTAAKEEKVSVEKLEAFSLIFQVTKKSGGTVSYMTDSIDIEPKPINI